MCFSIRVDLYDYRCAAAAFLLDAISWAAPKIIHVILDLEAPAKPFDLSRPLA